MASTVFVRKTPKIKEESVIQVTPLKEQLKASG